VNNSFLNVNFKTSSAIDIFFKKLIIDIAYKKIGAIETRGEVSLKAGMDFESGRLLFVLRTLTIWKIQVEEKRTPSII
jgi:hypothetical protein